MTNHNNGLEYTSDELRDTAHDLGKDPDEQRIQASMQEQTAKAMHRQAEAMENMAEEMRKLRKGVDSFLREEYGL